MSTALTCAFFRLISGVARGQMFRPETRPRARPRGSVAVVPENLSGGGRYVGGLGAALGFGAGQMVGPELGYASGATPEARLGAWSYEADFLRQNGAWRVKVGSRRGGGSRFGESQRGFACGQSGPTDVRRGDGGGFYHGPSFGYFSGYESTHGHDGSALPPGGSNGDHGPGRGPFLRVGASARAARLPAAGAPAAEGEGASPVHQPEPAIAPISSVNFAIKTASPMSEANRRFGRCRAFSSDLSPFKFPHFPMTIHSSLWLAGLAAGSVLFSGCATNAGVPNPAGVAVTELRPDERGFVAGTGVESQDLVAVTDKMARSILGIPQIARAPVPPSIVLDPVVNNTRFPINKDIFLTRIRTQLNTKAAGQVSFLDREMMKTLERERELKRSGQVTASADPRVVEFAGADYFLTGKLEGMTTRTAAGTSDYILYSFRLTDARTSRIVWEDVAEIKKQGLEDAAYR